MLNEILSNALKHAFPEGRSGKITISIELIQKNRCQIIVTDDGVGLPEKIDLETAEGLGLQLIKILTNQIDGTIEINRDKGTTFKIVFPFSCEN